VWRPLPLPDVDECTEGASPCDAHSECHDTDGGFYCTCTPGWEPVTGSGTACQGAHHGLILQGIDRVLYVKFVYGVRLVCNPPPILTLTLRRHRRVRAQAGHM
jgi:hypothetical protein